MVEVVISRVGEGKYEVRIKGEDHTLGNLINWALMESGLAKFSYYEVPHPLNDEIVIFMDIGDNDPKETLMRALEKALEVNSRFRDIYLKALREKGIEIEA